MGRRVEWTRAFEEGSKILGGAASIGTRVELLFEIFNLVQHGLEDLLELFETWFTPSLPSRLPRVQLE